MIHRANSPGFPLKRNRRNSRRLSTGLSVTSDATAGPARLAAAPGPDVRGRGRASQRGTKVLAVLRCQPAPGAGRTGQTVQELPKPQVLSSC